jgi:hypothetical protein
MTESVVQTQLGDTFFFDRAQDAQCKQVVSHGIYLVCADTGEVIDYDYDKYLVTNLEGIDDSLSKLNIVDKVFTHYRKVNPFLPYGGVSTIPAGYDMSLRYHSFAHRVSLLISDSTQRAVFTRVAQKILRRKIKNKLFILGAFAIEYCNVDPNQIVQLLVSYTQKNVLRVRQKLAEATLSLSYILSEELDLSKEEKQSLSKAKLLAFKQYVYNLLSKYGYTGLIDKFSKVYNASLIKVAVILLLLKDNRRDEAIQLYESPPKYLYGLKHIVVDYEINGERFVKKLTHGRLRSLLFNPSSRVFSIKIIP